MARLRRFLRRVLGAEPWRFWLGVPAAALAANLTPLLVLFLQAAVEQLVQGARLPQPTDLPQFLLAWLSSLFLFPYALLLTLVAGVPAHLLLVLLRRDAAWIYAAGGAMGGLLAFDGLEMLRGPGNPTVALMGLGAGLAAAIAFRAIWRPLRSSSGPAASRGNSEIA